MGLAMKRYPFIIIISLMLLIIISSSHWIMAATPRESIIIIGSPDFSRFWSLDTEGFSWQPYWERTAPQILVDTLFDDTKDIVYTIERTSEGATSEPEYNTIKRIDIRNRQEESLYSHEGIFQLSPHPNPDYLLVHYFPEPPTSIASSANICILSIHTSQCNDIDRNTSYRFRVAFYNANNILWVDDDEFLTLNGWLDRINIEEQSSQRLIEDISLDTGTLMPDGETLLLLARFLTEDWLTEDPHIFLYNLNDGTYTDLDYRVPSPKRDAYFVDITADEQTIIYSLDRNSPGFGLFNLQTGISHIFPEMTDIVWLDGKQSFLNITRQYSNDEWTGFVSRVEANTGEEEFWFSFRGYMYFMVLHS
jgi:hypothetical protein